MKLNQVDEGSSTNEQLNDCSFSSTKTCMLKKSDNICNFILLLKNNDI
jgi:hypothetical protein